MMTSARSTLLSELIASLRQQPEEWHNPRLDEKGQITLRHVSGVVLWVYMGGAYVYEPKHVYFGLIGKMRLRSAFRAWRRVQPDLRDVFASKVLAQFRSAR